MKITSMYKEVSQEQEELFSELIKLLEFIDSKDFDNLNKTQQDLMSKKASIMSDYNSILGELLLDLSATINGVNHE